MWLKRGKKRINKMVLSLSAVTIAATVLCGAAVADLGPGVPNHTSSTAHAAVQGSKTARITVPQVDAPVVVTYPTGIMPYFRNESQSFYSNVQEMRDSSNYPTLTATLTNLINEPAATWLGEWLETAEVGETVNTIVTQAVTVNQMPVLVSYNIPNRDLGQYSAGGVSGPAAYSAWIASISKGIGDRPAVVVLEPDALPGVLNMSKKAGDERVTMLRNALLTFTANNPRTYVYVDGGNSKWLQPKELVGLLNRVYTGTTIQARVSLNVSNARPTPELTTYFNKVNALYNNKLKTLFDVGLNGAATPPAVEDWCNPRGARHGTPDDTFFDPSRTIEQLMVRPVGESSGECDRNDPAAGEFDPDLMATILGLPSAHYKQ
jgi:endoglucanase